MYPLLHMTKYYGLCCVLATMYYCDIDPVTISMHMYYCVHYYAHVLLCPLLCTCIIVSITMHIYFMKITMHMYFVTLHMYYDDCYYAHHIFYDCYYAHILLCPLLCTCIIVSITMHMYY